MDTQYWIIRDGEMHGPFTIEELKTLEITPKTKIWYKDLKEWTAASETPVFPLIQPKNDDQTISSGCITPQPNTDGGKSENQAEPQEATMSAPPAFNRENYESQRQHATIPPFIPPVHPQTEEAFLRGYRKGLEEGKMLDKETDISKCPPTNLVWAILSTILCCLPVGIVAIVYASKVSNYFYSNNYLKAKKASDRALYWSLASMIVWMVTQPILSALSLLMGNF